MDIYFCGPAVISPEGGVSYRAKVDYRTIFCRISLDALKRVSTDNDLTDPMAQFQASKATLLAIAEQKIKAGQIKDNLVWITMQDFSKKED